ncbi:hypothetical protein [Chryseobacterium artocarpi]|nr:hypothetical protein [Chryseobacterium artocarpi]
MKKYFKEIMIVFVVILSRLPFIFNSLGSDLDGWREVYTGKVLHEEHIYQVSRFPGYPFPEFLYSLVYNAPYWCINLLSVLFTAGCSLFLFKILELIKAKFSPLIPIVFTFIPVIYLNSTIAMEYNWSLFFLLGAIYYILKKNIWISALFFGLIVSTRFNNIIFLPALLFLTYFYIEKSIKKVLLYSFLSILFTGILFSPVIIKYGPHFLQNSGDSEFNLVSILSLATLYIYGAIGTLAIGLGLIMQFFTGGYQKIKELGKNHFITFSAILIISNFIFFIKYPLEPGYLIPSVPFVLILLQYIMKEKMMKFVLFTLFLSPFFIHITAEKIRFKGMVLTNEDYEDQGLQYCSNLVQEIKKLSKDHHTIFHVGNLSEQIMLVGKFDKTSHTKIVKNLSKEQENAIINKKVKLYYINTIDGKIENEKNHILDQHGILFYKDFELNR